MTTDDYLSGVAVLSAVCAWAFVIRYGFWSPWRTTVVGRSLMYVWVILSIVLSLIAATRWLGDYPGRTPVRLIVFTALPIAFIRFTWVLVRIQTGRERGEIPSRVEAKL